MAGLLATRRPRSLFTPRREAPLGLRTEMEDLLTHFWGDDEEGWFGGAISPSLDLSETDGAVEVRMDLPGVKPEEIDIQLNNNVLTISGERKEEKEEKERAFHRVERRTGKFSRSFTLPCPVDENEVVAKHQEGVLSITLPKTREAQARKIDVKG